MTRRILLGVLIPALGLKLSGDAVSGVSVRGKLNQSSGTTPSVELPDHRQVALDGDEPTRGVLNDKRLNGVDFEALGHFTSDDKFAVDPIHLRAMFVHKGGKRLAVTYWCDVCYIRTYTPGVCWCCQKYTDIDLVDSGA